MNILGISAYYHDSAACIVQDGEVISAVQEERFSRKKHDHRFPELAIKSCLEQAGITGEQLDYVAFYDKPFIKFERLLETYLAYAPMGVRSFVKAMPLWIKQKLWIPDLIRKKLRYQGPIIYPEHHESHAASAFFPSPFQHAAFLTLDGVGEWTTTSFGVGTDNQVAIDYEIHFPHSLGLLYSAFTYYTGFKVNSGEYKMMGLAPYGEPKYVDLILEHLIDLKDDGSYKLNMRYFNYCAGLTMTNHRFHELFGGPPRKPETSPTQKEMDISRSIQVVTEEVILKTVGHVHTTTNEPNLCLAGGVALNCVANGRILREGPFEKIWVQPAAGDAGGALGAALFVWYQYLDNERNADNLHDSQQGSYWGPSYDDGYVDAYLKAQRIPHRRLSDEEISEVVAELIAQGKVVGWFQGRVEFGPRALGSRSILGDARSPQMQSTMNLKIKFRESFRPFAPSVLADHAHEWFELTPEGKEPVSSPYMLLVASVKGNKRQPVSSEDEQLCGIDKLKVCRSEIPAITHVDFSARVQTVHQDTNPRYYDLIKRFHEKTGCPLIVNTSFNVRGEPIVCSPEDAYQCFMRTEMDYLVMENRLLDKQEQPDWHEDEEWQKTFELD
jgi:carbamoyltransferase